MNKLARILVTNDDGIEAPGLAVAVAIAEALADEVWVVAPAADQSGRSQAITVRQPIRAVAHGPRRFAVSGTPADCVLLALGEWLVDAPPDLVIAGVNRGANISDTVVYSGTIGATLAADHAGLPAVALSQAFRGPAEQADFSPAIAYGHAVVAQCIARDWADDAGRRHCAWSVNFPAQVDDDPVRGIALARPAGGTTLAPRVARFDDDPEKFQLHFARGQVPKDDQNSDVAALRQRRIAVTPLTNARHDPVFEALSTNGPAWHLDNAARAR